MSNKAFFDASSRVLSSSPTAGVVDLNTARITALEGRLADLKKDFEELAKYIRSALEDIDKVRLQQAVLGYLLLRLGVLPEEMEETRQLLERQPKEGEQQEIPFVQPEYRLARVADVLLESTMVKMSVVTLERILVEDLHVPEEVLTKKAQDLQLQLQKEYERLAGSQDIAEESGAGMAEPAEDRAEG